MQNDNRHDNKSSIVLQVVSDLHEEWFDTSAHLTARDFAVSADATLIAGDTSHYDQAVNAVVKLFPESRPVFMIPGNHEHYDRSPTYKIDNGIAQMKERASAASRSLGRRIDVLEDDVSYLETPAGTARIIGSTLWTDFEISGDPDAHMMTAMRHLVSDYGVTALLPSETIRIHKQSREFLRDTLATPFDGPSVVMTHHLPSARSISPDFAGQASNAAFASNLDDLIGTGQATLWVHGHTHGSIQYRDASGTLIVCNPLGRPHKHVAMVFENRYFKPKLTVSLQQKDGQWQATSDGY